ncbi:MAG: NADH-quinone oxidoreductase subunit [Chthoniobacter sp.]|jgi:NADH-quinone oxidoreductase subunit F|nr:NADH-quinone oxidoreductase subunit [Chthoniobacter sp.]
MIIPDPLLAKIDEAITHYPVSKRSASLPLLHLWQEHFGYIEDEAVAWIAQKLELSPINVLELVTFYPMFRRQPAGKRHIRICRTLSCAMAGSYRLKEAVAKAAGIDLEKWRRGDSEAEHGDQEHDAAHHVHNAGHGNPIAVSEDGNFSVEFVECLASCGSAPVAMVDDLFREHVGPDEGEILIRQQISDATRKKVLPPHPREKRLVFKNIDRAGWTNDIECYLNDGGYEDLKKAFKMKPEEIVDEVKRSGLRGRGGAGFPCGVKWGFIKRGGPKPIYLICNADESEPGTFKDRYIIHQDPHQLIEGMIISCFAVDAHLAYIYIRGEFPEGAQILEKALAEAQAKGFLGRNVFGSGFDLEIYVHRGAGAYICGEETGLIESLEGKRAYPRIKPPYFPAVLGLYQCPTIVNNVETLCDVKHIISMGGTGFAKLGKPNNTGTRILCVSGDVVRPGYFEVEVGSVTMGELIYDLCGGLKEGRKLKAVIPGGSSAKVLKAGEKYKIKDKELTLEEIPMDFDTLAAAGSMAGSGGVIVMDDSRDMVEMLNNINEFYAHESCGQCTPCREGALWMKKITDRVLAGGGTEQDPEVLKNVADNIAGKTICAFGEACAWPTQSFVLKFREEFVAKAKKLAPPPMPPEYTSEELIEHPTIETLRDVRTGSPLAPAATK